MEKIKAVVLSVEPLTERISAFRLKRQDGAALPPWTGGAHIDVDLAAGSRTYSLIDFDAPDGAPSHYTIAVQREPEGGGGSRAMHDLRAGDEIIFSPPKNDFAVRTDAPGVFIAGGIGVTPLVAMAATARAAGQPVTFHYAGRCAGVMAFREQLSDTFGEAFHLHCDDGDKALNLDDIISNLGDAHLYVCGPRGMIEAAREKAASAGVPSDRIHFELFATADRRKETSRSKCRSTTGLSLRCHREKRSSRCWKKTTLT